MLGEGNVFMIDNNTKVLCNQTQVLVGRPLKEQRYMTSEHCTH